MTDESFRRRLLEGPSGGESEPGSELDARARALLIDLLRPLPANRATGDDLEERIAALYLKLMSKF